MQMTLRARILDILPVLVVFAFVAAFATIVVVEYIVRQPLAIPPSHVSANSDYTPASSTDGR